MDAVLFWLLHYVTENAARQNHVTGQARQVERIVKENELIPAMLRTVEYEQVSKEQLRGIIEDLKSGRYKKARSKG